MSIRPTDGTTSPPPPVAAPAATAPPTESAEFASTLADIASQAGSDAEHVRPPAERWGQYGRGAQPGGYGPVPDASQFAEFPVGGGFRASPLNPNGTTMDPAFTVPGYTGRGTPIPPGFYNLAYYQQYLREGGTPLLGFPGLEDGTSIAETYGTFGDGRARATSFADGFGDVTDTLAGTGVAIGDPSTEGNAQSTASAAAPAEPSAATVAADPATSTGTPAAAVASAAKNDPAGIRRHATTAETPATDAPAATSVRSQGAAPAATPAVDLGRATFEVEIASLIDVLLRG